MAPLAFLFPPPTSRSVCSPDRGVHTYGVVRILSSSTKYEYFLRIHLLTPSFPRILSSSTAYPVVSISIGCIGAGWMNVLSMLTTASPTWGEDQVGIKSAWNRTNLYEYYSARTNTAVSNTEYCSSDMTSAHHPPCPFPLSSSVLCPGSNLTRHLYVGSLARAHPHFCPGTEYG